jgi:hypothetical protein
MNEFPFTAYALRDERPVHVVVTGREGATPFQLYLVDDGNRRWATVAVFDTVDEAAAAADAQSHDLDL